MQAIRLGGDFEIGREKVLCRDIDGRFAQNGMGNEGCRSKAQGLYLISVRVPHQILVKFPPLTLQDLIVGLRIFDLELQHSS